MCGLAGLLRLRGQPLADPGRVGAMAETLRHRGPDAGGDLAGASFAWGFRRLRAIDLAAGEQPIANEDGSVQVMLDGEIYNYRELRGRLQALGHVFRTQSDTEVLVHGWESWGLGLLDALRGLFAFALWDGRHGRTLLARDRVGKKPLFYAFDPATAELAFASELKGLAAWDGLDRAIDAHALDAYLTFLYVPGPRTIFAQARCLPPGHHLLIDHGAAMPPEPQRWWSPALLPDESMTEEQAAEALREALTGAVRLRLRSDVPIGAFLSSGIDSTLVAGLAAKELGVSGAQLETFTLGFDDWRFDERAGARQTASAIGSNHHEEVFDADTFSADEVVALCRRLDQPFGDSSFLTTYWLSRMMRRSVTVALSGYGGGELFAGYRRYADFDRIEQLQEAPFMARAVIRQLAGFWRKLGFVPPLAERLRQVEKALQLAELPLEGRILGLLTYFEAAEKDALLQPGWRRGGAVEQLVTGQLEALPEELDPLALFQRRDLFSSLVDDGLTRVDRASMACSLEVRCPLLDQQVVELALRVPTRMHFARGVGKQLLKRAFPELLSQAVLKRPKRGFKVPFGRYFQRKDWRELLLDQLSEERLRREGYFQPATVLRWRDALLNNSDAHGLGISAYQLRHRVWALLVFQIWRDQYAP
jgi:asparagine synthase (glutamine-hydrolysing)